MSFVSPPGLFLRILIAAVVVIFLNLVLPPFFRILSFPLNGDVLLILRIAIAAVALYYVITSSKPI